MKYMKLVRYLYKNFIIMLNLLSEIASAKREKFDKDKDFLVLPLDATKFDTHGEAVKTVLDHFNQVWSHMKFFSF